ncbi:MAG: ATP-dependent protease, partial [Candidatus Dadabacteria bacterium]
MPTEPLSAERLRARCDSRRLPFETTAEVDPERGPMGQDRALEALDFGVGVPHEGYNLFLMGPPGIGKRSLAERILRERAAKRPTPSDWCYVYNFDVPHKPWAIELEAGKGVQLRRDMERLVDDLRTQIPAAFESEEYRARAQEIEEEFKEKQEQAIRTVAEEAEKEGLKLLRSPGGFVFAPVAGDEVMDPEQFARLPAEEQEAIKSKISRFQERLQQVIQEVLKWGKENRNRLRELNREVALAAVGYLIAELKKQYADNERVQAYLDKVEADVLEHVDEFRQGKGQEGPNLFGIPINLGKPSLERYQVNVLVDRSGTEGAPVVFEDHPTYQNLVGRVEHRAQMGALTTDFTLIKAGALHRANGGYLVLDARKVLMQPFAWEALKTAIRSREIRIESLGEMLSVVSTVSLEPEHIPLDVKVVLVGDRLLYYLLYHFDPEFPELFKVCADFEDAADREDQTIERYARAVAAAVRDNGLNHLDREAFARVVEELSREVGDGEKLSLHMGKLCDLLREADFWARRDGSDLIREVHVDRAVAAATRRIDRVRELVHEQIERGTVLIDTRGSVVGQINGLSVLSLGNFRFGQPSRITATARIGKGEVIDIEREVKLGGPTHSKGVLI